MSRKCSPRTWQNEDVVAALRSMKTEGLSLRGAARAYGIPRSTLQDKFQGRAPIFARQGPDPTLTREEEQKIVDWSIKMGRMGLRQTFKDIQSVVKTLIEKDGRENPFANNTPGRRWWTSFLKRNPDLVHRQVQPNDKERVKASDQRIEMWFSEFEARLQRERALSMLTDPQRLFEDENESAIDSILKNFPGSTTQAPSTPGPSTPGPTQVASTPTSNVLPQETPLTGPPPLDVAQTPQGNETSGSCIEYLAALPGMSQNQRKKKGLPPPAITVAEFFRYVRARKVRENREQKRKDMRMMREFKQREMEEAEEMNDENICNGQDDREERMELATADREERMELATADREERMELATAVMMLDDEGESVAEVTVSTIVPELEKDWNIKQEVERPRKRSRESKEVQAENKKKVLEIMNSAHLDEVEQMRKELREQRVKAKKVKQAKGKEKEKKRDRKRKGTSRKKTREEKPDAGESKRDTIVEAKDKVRTQANIKSITNDQEIYVCPACLKSSGDNEKWIKCDHCVRWLHLSCTSMHLLRGIDLAGFDYRCKFC